ncbi:MAG: Verru_Chthon cassette protein D [Chthoniobacteraceae bacterium]
MKPPPPHRQPNANPFRNNGFTLLELIVVIGVMALISVLVMPSTGRFMGASRLSQSSQLLVNELSLARQQAITRNSEIEVRIYQFGDPDVPGETPSSPASGRYRALQTFEITASGSAIALGKIQRLATSVMIDAGVLSSIISSSGGTPSVPVATTGDALGLAIPKVGTQYNAVCFRFLPDGSARLKPQTGKWFLTLHGSEAGDGLSTPPPNFFTVQINALNGHIQTFRP